MFVLDIPPAATKPETYAALYPIAASLLEGERDFIANAANISSLLFHTLPDLNWCGFYILRDGELVLGPFQGRPACVRIAMGRGVCGTAADRRETVVVPDVRAFPGHIACDAASRSEIVVPITASGRLVGVLDLDSPMPGRFDDDDRNGLEQIVRTFIGATDVRL
ncbi:MAG TPA: GAF domain-containing protein [Candidatus Kapabacteria bacterium]|nr:GAF domain-containing protein [Candidatus Kapabacteria bacterium]